MSALQLAHPTRATAFAPRLQALLNDYLGQELFRLDADTVGVAGPHLSDRLLAARPATDVERPTFKPLHGRAVPRTDAAKLMQAIGRDVREALQQPMPDRVDLTGPWPQVGHLYLRDLLLGGDPARLRVLMSRNLELTPKLTWSVIAAGALAPLTLHPDASALARVTVAAQGYTARRYAMGLYRRTAAPVCFTVSTLVANALWLGSPFDPAVSSRNIVYESLRLLPPSWNILRNASPEFPPLDARIGHHDDVLVLPLLSHRDPALWEDPAEFRPQRWESLDPDAHAGYLPFGHASERCWGRHMVMPLAERLLDALRQRGLAVDPRQRHAQVPLAGLLGVAEVNVVRL
ncbi:cytochrome P450 [Xanthomonas maliensis]|uniref:cytochrome P450 n=1 Tax=Xanthomonas maliensis TaxID=1321368 RepID=UPI00039E2AB6|nr:cytochrome P450 [Xanthomonas maliensis]KAB7764733.1 cytochrome P450 [Xanthomonas maliensis]